MFNRILFSIYATLIQFSTYFLEQLLCTGMGQRADEIMESTGPNLCPQGVHRLAGETHPHWTQPDIDNSRQVWEGLNKIGMGGGLLSGSGRTCPGLQSRWNSFKLFVLVV